MRFVIETTYNQKGMTVMARTLHKTLRRKTDILSNIFAGGLL